MGIFVGTPALVHIEQTPALGCTALASARPRACALASDARTASWSTCCGGGRKTHPTFSFNLPNGMRHSNQLWIGFASGSRVRRTPRRPSSTPAGANCGNSTNRTRRTPPPRARTRGLAIQSCTSHATSSEAAPNLKGFGADRLPGDQSATVDSSSACPDRERSKTGCGLKTHI